MEKKIKPPDKYDVNMKMKGRWKETSGRTSSSYVIE